MDLLSSWADGPGCQRYVRVWGFMHRTWVLGPDEFPQGGGEQKPKARGREVGGGCLTLCGVCKGSGR